MKLYKIVVHKSFYATTPVGMHTSLLIGDAISVEGQPHVRMPHGGIEPAGDGWHDTLQAAQAVAAEQIAEIGRRITQQADCLREDARG